MLIVNNILILLFRILKVLCKNIDLAPDFDFEWLAHNTPGYVGADLKTLVGEAMENGFSRYVKFYVFF